MSAAEYRRAALSAPLRVIAHASHPAAFDLGLTVHLPARAWRPGPFGVSCHTAADVDRAFDGGALYVTLSPVWPTSKPGDDRHGLGPDRFLEIAAGRPVLALGGVTPPRWHALRARGAHGAAVMSGLFADDDPAAVMRAYQNG